MDNSNLPEDNPYAFHFAPDQYQLVPDEPMAGDVFAVNDATPLGNAAASADPQQDFSSQQLPNRACSQSGTTDLGLRSYYNIGLLYGYPVPREGSAASSSAAERNTQDDQTPTRSGGSQPTTHVNNEQQGSLGHTVENINTEQANSTSANHSDGINSQHLTFTLPNTSPSLPVLSAFGMSGNTYPNTSSVTAQGMLQAQHVYSQDDAWLAGLRDAGGDLPEQALDDTEGPSALSPSTDERPSECSDTANNVPDPRYIFSNVPNNMPWYIPVIPFETASTASLCNPDRLSDKHIAGFPRCDQPAPVSLTMRQYISQYPNHLMYEGLDCIIQRLWSAGQVLERVFTPTQSSMIALGIMSERDRKNVFQRRLDERIKKLGKEGIVALRELPPLRSDPEDVIGKAQPFNLNPQAPLRPTKEQRDQRKAEMLKLKEEQAQQSSGAGDLRLVKKTKTRATRHNALRLPQDVQPEDDSHAQAASPAAAGDIRSQFEINVCANSTLDIPLGFFWELTFWDDHEQFEAFKADFHRRFNACWELAGQLVQSNPDFTGESNLVICLEVLWLLGFEAQHRNMFEEAWIAVEQAAASASRTPRNQELVDSAFRGAQVKHMCRSLEAAMYNVLLKMAAEYIGGLAPEQFDRDLLRQCRDAALAQVATKQLAMFEGLRFVIDAQRSPTSETNQPSISAEALTYASLICGLPRP